MNIISPFNPDTMDDTLIELLNTGREREIEIIADTIRRNILRQQSPQHILIHGSRGIGKSFLLRLLKINIKRSGLAEYILLPEEQSNIQQPEDFLKAIRSHGDSRKADSGMGSWNSGGREAWDRELEALKQYCSERKIKHLVVGIENFDLLFNKKGSPFSDMENQHLLRAFLTESHWFTLIATTVHGDLDVKYDKALFHAFAKYEMTPWEEANHETYLHKHAGYQGSKAGGLSTAQLKALCKFTGGLPRITVIMVEVLAHDRLDSAAKTLEKTIDMLTPFYQDLIEKMPHKSKLLFDALLRGGEPCSQSELASRVNATQNLISQSFNWLMTNNHIWVDSAKGEKQKLYSVRDRLFAHFYQMRYILHGTGKTVLCLMGEFLSRFYSSRELKDRAMEFYEKGQEAESRDLMHLALESSGIKVEALQWKDDLKELIQALELKDMDDIPKPKNFEEAQKLLRRERDMLAACTNYPGNIDSKEFAWNLFSSFAVSFHQKISIAQACIKKAVNEKQIKELKKNFSDEKQRWQNLFGKVFLIFQKELGDGVLILDYLNDKKIEILKEKNEEIFNVLVLLVQGLRKIYLPELSPITPETLLAAHEYIYKSSISEKNYLAQAWNLGRIGWNLSELGRHEEALNAHNKALELSKKEGNNVGQAWNLRQIGWSLKELGRHEGALNAHNKALELQGKEGNITGQAQNLERIGWNLKKLGRHDEAVDAHNKAQKLWTKEENTLGQARNLGQMTVSLLLQEKDDEAWKLLIEHAEKLGESRYEMIKQLGGAVCFYSQKKEIARAFSTGTLIFEKIRQSGDIFDPSKSLQHFFIDLLYEKVDLSLVGDLVAAAVKEFGESFEADLAGVSGIIEFVKSGRDKNLLLKMNPDQRRVVEAIVKELKL